MTKLYRIKPLEWAEPDYRGALLSRPHRYTILPLKGGASLRTRHDQWKFKSIEEAVKFANHHHQECMVDDFLEPAYQPIIELPKEPGLYWFKDRLSRKWRTQQVEERLGEMAVIIGGDAIFVSEMQGLWVRNPEPEVEE